MLKAAICEKIGSDFDIPTFEETQNLKTNTSLGF